MSHGSAISFTCDTTGSCWIRSKNADEPVDVVQLARERRGEIEAEAVDVHLLDPVAQRVHDQLQHCGLRMFRLLPVPV